ALPAIRVFAPEWRVPGTTLLLPAERPSEFGTPTATTGSGMEETDLAPTLVRQEDCVVEAYNGNVPIPLLANIFVFYNDGKDVIEKIARLETSNHGPHQNVPTQTVLIETATLDEASLNTDDTDDKA
ncbi:MAG: hypothetical protein P8077_04370, partial [Gammaproteobacteria bacterium]